MIKADPSRVQLLPGFLSKRFDKPVVIKGRRGLTGLWVERNPVTSRLSAPKCIAAAEPEVIKILARHFAA